MLDGTIVNIALPQAQIALDMDDHLRQWVVTAYGFALASPCAGLASAGWELILCRALQGVFALITSARHASDAMSEAVRTV